MRLPHFLISIITSLFFHTAAAWSSQGHQLVATIASMHPAYKHVESTIQSDIKPLLSLTPSVHDFVSSSHWLDDLKSDTHVFDPWHYIDLDIETGMTNSSINVVFAIQHLEKEPPGSSPFYRAFRVYALSHLVGDIHQPLHCADRGDRGGNDFHIHGVAHVRNLHALWDEGAGLFSGAHIPDLAASIMAEFPDKDKEDSYASDPSAWAIESWNLAKQYVYNDIEPDTVPSDQYIAQSQEIVKQQVARAGYRLAKMLSVPT